MLESGVVQVWSVGGSHKLPGVVTFFWDRLKWKAKGHL